MLQKPFEPDSCSKSLSLNTFIWIMLWLLRHGTRTTTTTQQKWKKTKGLEEQFWWKAVLQMVTDECNATLHCVVEWMEGIELLDCGKASREEVEVKCDRPMQKRWNTENLMQHLQKYKENEWTKGCVQQLEWKAIELFQLLLWKLIKLSSALV